MKYATSRAVSVLRLASVSLLLGAVALLLVGTPVVGAGGKKEPSKVKLTATAGPLAKDGTQVVTITMDIEKDWHAYANPVKFEELEAAQTTVSIASGTKLQAVNIDYPEGKRETVGKDTYYVYEGKVEIKATVKRAAGDVGPLDVSVKYMVCNKSMCLAPEQVKLQVK
jgi:DsbC/DsbD-like thiol-disulfide interchange protein